MQINHILCPLVNALIELWNMGLFLRHTHRYPFSCRSRIGVIPLVTDLPAGRKMAGFGSCNCKHFCSCCHTTLENKDNIKFHTWTPRQWPTHLQFARKWRDTQTLQDQEKVFDQSGVRWLELLRLPYWDPMSYSTIDSMHCFYLGLFHHHILKIWGMQENAADGLGVMYDALVKTRPSSAELDRAHSHLQHERWICAMRRGFVFLHDQKVFL